MLINKRRNSDPAPAVNNGDLDISAPRQTEKTATELCSFAIIWWSFLGLVRFFKVDGIWGPEGGVSRRMVEKKLKLWRIANINWISFFIKVNLPYILWVTAYNTSFLLFYLGLDMWIFSGGNSRGEKITKHHKKADAPPPPPRPPAQQIQFGNPPPLLDLINRHSLAIFLLVNMFFPFDFNIIIMITLIYYLIL